MSITLPPLPPTDTEIEDAAHSALQEALAFGVGLEAFRRPLKTLAKQFREADRASRVPMTEAQVASFLDAWATSSRSMKLIGLIRAIESHYSIGATP